jgi:signal transduction histidine kinase
MQQIVGNLLSNAIKYSNEGGDVEVSVFHTDAHALIRVQDHGQGIAESELPLLFRPFQTTSTRPTAGEQSTGLGLAIVHKLVEAHGGTVSVESALERGTTFTVSLPIAEHATSARRAEARDTSDTRGHEHRHS